MNSTVEYTLGDNKSIEPYQRFINKSRGLEYKIA